MQQKSSKRSGSPSYVCSHPGSDAVTRTSPCMAVAVLLVWSLALAARMTGVPPSAFAIPHSSTGRALADPRPPITPAPGRAMTSHCSTDVRPRPTTWPDRSVGKSSNGLEVLERLQATPAVMDGTAQCGTEEGFQVRVGGVAIGAGSALERLDRSAGAALARRGEAEGF